MAETVDLVALTAGIVSAYAAATNLHPNDLPTLITSVHDQLAALGQTTTEPPPAGEAEGKRAPAVSVRASVRPDYLVCLVCGTKQKTLRRHLASAHSLDPQQYRQEFGLKPDYPMTASGYSEQRRELAKSSGLGRKPGETPAEAPDRSRQGADAPEAA